MGVFVDRLLGGGFWVLVILFLSGDGGFDWLLLYVVWVCYGCYYYWLDSC